MDGKLTIVDETEEEEEDDGEGEEDDEEEEGGENESDEEEDEDSNLAEAGPIMTKIMQILNTPSNKLEEKTAETTVDLIDQAMN